MACAGLDRDPVVGLVAVLHAEVVVFEIDVEKRQDQLVLDHRPDDAGHLVAVHLHDRVLHLDLGHVENSSSNRLGHADVMEFNRPPARIAAVCLAESTYVHSIVFEVRLQHCFNDVFRHDSLQTAGSGWSPERHSPKARLPADHSPWSIFGFLNSGQRMDTGRRQQDEADRPADQDHGIPRESRSDLRRESSARSPRTRPSTPGAMGILYFRIT